MEGSDHVHDHVDDTDEFAGHTPGCGGIPTSIPRDLSILGRPV
jgi:hypothetical protein